MATRTAQMAPPAPPRLGHSLSEFGRIFLEAGISLCLRPLQYRLPSGDGHTVMALPGFLGADGTMASLRGFLGRRGYRAVPWGLGRNVPADVLLTMSDFMAFRQEKEAALARLLAAEVERSGGRVSLVGWSLGGLYATGLAHRHPRLVRQVVTLGTPFGDPRATALFSVLQRLYGGDSDERAVREWIDLTFSGRLKVPVTALYSTSDGVVGADIARLPEHPLMENIAVLASHVGFPFNPLVQAVLAERLAQGEGAWKPYAAPSRKPFVYWQAGQPRAPRQGGILRRFLLALAPGRARAPRAERRAAARPARRWPWRKPRRA